MPPPASLFIAALSLFASASAAAAPSLCALVATETSRSESFVLAALRADGTLGGPPIALATEPISGILACSAAAGSCLYSPPLADQASVGLVEVDIAARAAKAYKLRSPAGFAGAYVIGALAASEVPGDAVALMASAAGSDAPWVAAAELTPADGVPRVRVNLTAESFQQLSAAMGSAYDGATRTLYVNGAAGGNAGLFAAPLGPPAAVAAPPSPTWLPNATLPATFLPLGFAFCGGAAQSVVGVGVVAPPSVYGMISLSAKTLTWRSLISWTKETLYLSGLGQIACSPDGTTAHAVFSDAKGVHIIPAVDTATGKEVSRITMANATFFVGALAFCPPDFA